MFLKYYRRDFNEMFRIEFKPVPELRIKHKKTMRYQFQENWLH